MLIELLIGLLIVGGILYIIQSVPIDATIKRIIYVVVVIAVAIYALRHLAGVLP